MRKLLAMSAVSVLPFLATVGTSWATDGEKIFQSKGCVACHDATQDRVSIGLGPALKQIAASYKGHQDALVEFLKGEGKPKVYPAKYPIMQAQLAMIKGLSPEDRQALAKFLLTH